MRKINEKIISIDDSKSVQSFLKSCLENCLESYTTFPDGQKAVDHLKDNINNYDLIFLDWEMPIKDGPTTFYELKELGLKTPVLMLTSKNDPKDIVKMIEAGVFDYLMKPFTQDIIEGKINLLFP